MKNEKIEETPFIYIEDEEKNKRMVCCLHTAYQLNENENKDEFKEINWKSIALFIEAILNEINNPIKTKNEQDS